MREESRDGRKDLKMDNDGKQQARQRFGLLLCSWWRWPR